MDRNSSVDITKYLKHKSLDKHKTYSGYKKSQVWASFQKELLKNNIDQALNWYVELMLSGLSIELFDKLIDFYMKEINIANPKLPSYLLSEYIKFTEIINILDCDHQIIANHQVIRNHFCEIVSILCLSNKQKTTKTIKFKNSEFTPNIIRQKIEAKNSNILKSIWKSGDYQDFYIPLNEFCWHLNVTKNKTKALYWISWVYEWYKLCNKKFRDVECASRPINGVTKKYWNSFVWIIWEILIKEAKQRKNPDLLKQIRAISSLFRYNFKKTKVTSRFNYIATAIVYLTKSMPPIDFTLEIYKNYEILININCKINIIFNKIGSKRTWFIKKKQQDDFYNNEFMNTVIKKKSVEQFPTIFNLKKKKTNEPQLNNIYVPGDIYKKAINNIRENKKHYLPKTKKEPVKIIGEIKPKIDTKKQERHQQMLKIDNFLFKKKLNMFASSS